MTSNTFKVPNISCGHCVMTIQREVSELEGVVSVKAEEASKEGYRYECSLCGFVRRLFGAEAEYEEFWKHIDRSRIEFLEGLKSLIDRRIERIKKGDRKRGSR